MGAILVVSFIFADVCCRFVCYITYLPEFAICFSAYGFPGDYMLYSQPAMPGCKCFRALRILSVFKRLLLSRWLFCHGSSRKRGIHSGKHAKNRSESILPVWARWLCREYGAWLCGFWIVFVWDVPLFFVFIIIICCLLIFSIRSSEGRQVPEMLLLNHQLYHRRQISRRQ